MSRPRLTGSRCQCADCGKYFGSVRGFDRHRVGKFDNPAKRRRCLTLVELLARGWDRDARGFLLTPDLRRPQGHAGASISGSCNNPSATVVQEGAP